MLYAVCKPKASSCFVGAETGFLGGGNIVILLKSLLLGIYGS